MNTRDLTTTPISPHICTFQRPDGSLTRKPALTYSSGFLHTRVEENGVNGMIVFSTPKSPSYISFTSKPEKDVELERKFALSFHGKHGVNVKILKENAKNYLADNGKLDKEKLYKELEKGKNNTLNGCCDSDENYYIHAKVSNPEEDHALGIVVIMHKNSLLYQQWESDKKLAPEFTI